MGMRLELPGGALSDGVVCLRPFGMADEDWVFETCSTDREISRWTRVPWPYTREHAREFLGRTPELWQAGTDATFAIIDAADGRRLGSVGIHRIAGTSAGDELADEVGYWLAEDARGHGAATRAVRLISAWAFTCVGRPRLHLQTLPANVRSQRVAARAGYTRMPEMDEAAGHLVFRLDAPR